jgi:hemerythrin superfamily protein
MNAIVLLTEDHRTVDSLFTQGEQDGWSDPETVNRIVKELSIHDAIEKQHLYPAVSDRVPAGVDLADHSLDEHAEVAATLTDIDRMGADDPARPDRLARLVRLVRAHVDEEESKVFPAMRSAMSPAELDDLGATLAEAKSGAPTRPHPYAPDGGLGAKVAGAVSAPLDKVRDKMSDRP